MKPRPLFADEKTAAELFCMKRTEFRRRGVMELAWHGCTDDEIAAYSGHTSRDMIAKYAGEARQVMRARQAREKRR